MKKNVVRCGYVALLLIFRASRPGVRRRVDIPKTSETNRITSDVAVDRLRVLAIFTHHRRPYQQGVRFVVVFLAGSSREKFRLGLCTAFLFEVTRSSTAFNDKRLQLNIFFFLSPFDHHARWSTSTLPFQLISERRSSRTPSSSPVRTRRTPAGSSTRRPRPQSRSCWPPTR